MRDLHIADLILAHRLEHHKVLIAHARVDDP